MKNKFLKSFLIVLLSVISVHAQQDISPEVKKIIAESSVLDRWVTKEQWKEIVKEMAAKPGTEKVIVVDTRDQQNCFGVLTELRAEGLPAEESLCEKDITKPRAAISVGFKISSCIIEVTPNMGVDKNKCPYVTLKVKW